MFSEIEADIAALLKIDRSEVFNILSPLLENKEESHFHYGGYHFNIDIMFENGYILGMLKKIIFILLTISIITSSAYSSNSNQRRIEMKLTSSAFQHEDMIPVKFTCKGEDISPDLKWENAPQGVKSYVLICDDPDAPVGVWDHWMLFNIPGSTNELHEGVPKKPELANGARHGKNSWGRLDYGGPCPPSGVHRYFFKLFALDTILNLKSGASKKEIMKAMENHTLASAELMGKFKK
jgi:Raf kinase inhibitor-like YbhB/YbcL family protein